MDPVPSLSPFGDYRTQGSWKYASWNPHTYLAPLSRCWNSLTSWELHGFILPPSSGRHPQPLQASRQSLDTQTGTSLSVVWGHLELCVGGGESLYLAPEMSYLYQESSSETMKSQLPWPSWTTVNICGKPKQKGYREFLRIVHKWYVGVMTHAVT